MNKYRLAQWLLMLAYFVLISLLPALGVTDPSTFGLIGWVTGALLTTIIDVKNEQNNS